MAKRQLGIDLGTASIGWAVVELNDDLGSIIAMGTRSFEEPVESKSREPKNAARRLARLARRNLNRRSGRKRTMREILRKHNMEPSSTAELRAWQDQNPYPLRAEAQTSQVTLQELGRIFLHLAQRRGFLSNRKAKFGPRTGIDAIDQLIELDETADLTASEKDRKKSDDGPVLQAISQLKDEITSSNLPSLGSFFHDQLSRGGTVRGRHTLRAMFIDEFESIWQVQRKFYPQVLTDALRAEIHTTLFHQRPLKEQSSKRSNCRLEPTKKVTHRAHPLFQELRIWQDLSNIRLFYPNNADGQLLTLEQKHQVAQVLQAGKKPVNAKKGELSWTEFRNLLGLPKAPQVTINLELGKAHPALQGNITHVRLSQRTKGVWETLTPEVQDQVFSVILENAPEASKLKRLCQELGLDPETAYQIAIAPLVSGTSNLSLRAIKKLLPHLRAGLKMYDAQIAAGYTPEHDRPSGSAQKLEFCDIPDTRNPSVNKCIHEARKLVNAIVRQYGMPDKIVVELARDLSLNREAKAEIKKQNDINQAQNRDADAKFAEYFPNSKPSREDRIKYRLWKECEGTCPYTGQTIGLAELWTKAWEIEHIIPFSISLDDSYNNKTLAPSEVNAQKSNKTPFQYFAGRPEDWELAKLRIQKFKCSNHKKKLFKLEKIEDEQGFVARQLNDTRYASRVIRDFLTQLEGPEVVSATGKHTAFLRHHWGLHDILDDSGDKNRMDHRHHAIDALAVALTTAAYIKRISDANRTKRGPKLEIPVPWPHFRSDVVAAVNQILVSHEPQHKLRGALHEDTGYGVHKQSQELTTRKALADLTAGEILRIVDQGLKAKVLKALREEGFIPNGSDEDSDEKATGWSVAEKKQVAAILANFAVPDQDGVLHPVKRVKIVARKQDRELYAETSRGLFPTGSNHWLLILQRQNSTERTAKVVSLWDAVHLRKPELHVPKGWDLLFILYKQDMLMLSDGRGPYRVVKFSRANPVYLTLRLHHRADEAADVRIQTVTGLGLLTPPLTVGMLRPEVRP